MRNTLMFIVLAGLACATRGQELLLKASPASLRILPGAPAEFQLTVANNSGKSLVLIGETLDRALSPQGALLCDSSDHTLNCSDPPTTITVTSKLPPCDAPKVAFPPDAVVKMGFGIYSQRSCPLRHVPPGEYTGKLWIEAQLCEDGANPRVIRQTLSIPITVEEPQGEDAAYLKALLKAAAQAEPKFSGTYGGELKWMEVLQSPRIHPDKIALSNFPTSTYAGYVLAKKVFDYSNPLFKPVPPAAQVRISRDEGKTVVAFPETDFERYFKQLDTFMKGGHIPANLAAVLYGFYGDLLVQRGRFAEATAAFKEAVKTEPSDPKGQAYYHRAQDFLAALEGKNAPASTQRK